MPATLVSQTALPDNLDGMDIDSDETPTSLTLPAYRNRALTSRQERILVTFLDDLFLQLTRNYKKRSVYLPSQSTLPAPLLVFLLPVRIFPRC